MTVCVVTSLQKPPFIYGTGQPYNYGQHENAHHCFKNHHNVPKVTDSAQLQDGLLQVT